MGNTTNMTAELMGENMSKQFLTFVCGSKATPSLISAMKKLSAKNEAILKRGKNIIFLIKTKCSAPHPFSHPALVT